MSFDRGHVADAAVVVSKHAAVMSFEVEGEMIRPRECPVTHFALEGFVARVLADVPCQLVGPGELPAAVLPRADVRLLAGVGPQVSLQVAGLGVALPAARVPARVGRQLPAGKAGFDDPV